MKTPLLALFSLIASSITSVFAAPDAGSYTGLVTINKIVNNLSHSYTLRAEASVAPDGQITILTAVPESPSAAINVDNSVTVAQPSGETTVTRTDLARIGVIFQIRNYVIDDTLPAILFVTGQGFNLSYTSPAPAVATLAPKRTHVNFKFMKKR